MWFAFKNLQSKLLAENVNINYNLLYIFYYLLSWSWTLEYSQETFFWVSKRKWFTMERLTATARSLRKSQTSWFFKTFFLFWYLIKISDIQSGDVSTCQKWDWPDGPWQGERVCWLMNYFHFNSRLSQLIHLNTLILDGCQLE